MCLRISIFHTPAAERSINRYPEIWRVRRTHSALQYIMCCNNNKFKAWPIYCGNLAWPPAVWCLFVFIENLVNPSSRVNAGITSVWPLFDLSVLFIFLFCLSFFVSSYVVLFAICGFVISPVLCFPSGFFFLPELLSPLAGGNHEFSSPCHVFRWNFLPIIHSARKLHSLYSCFCASTSHCKVAPAETSSWAPGPSPTQRNGPGSARLFTHRAGAILDRGSCRFKLSGSTASSISFSGDDCSICL